MTLHIARTPSLVHLTVLALLAFTVYRSEAFASSHSRFATGRRLSVYNYIRGGSETAGISSQQSPHHTLGLGLSQSKGKSQSITPLTCVMQVPPTQAKGSTASSSSPEDDGSSSNKLNGSSSSKSSKLPRSMPSLNKNVLAADPVVPAEYVAETKLPTDIGQFQLRAYRVAGLPVGTEPCVIYARDKPPFGVGIGADGSDNLNQHVPVRIHDQCLTSEVFRSQRYVKIDNVDSFVRCRLFNLTVPSRSHHPFT
jgi:hypothetical protein